MDSSMPRSPGAAERCGAALLGLVVLAGLGGCLGATPDRARIVEARLVRDAGRVELELIQDLRFSRSMRDALTNGIPLRLVYGIEGCEVGGTQVLELRYLPLLRHYELQRLGDAQSRSFARRSTLLASLDRIRLPLLREPTPGCRGRVSMALDLTSLPTPLRIPAFLQRAEWRLISASTAWASPSARA
jgi:hypothetical protein